MWLSLLDDVRTAPLPARFVSALSLLEEVVAGEDVG